jgi:hypothetical protein
MKLLPLSQRNLRAKHRKCPHVQYDAREPLPLIIFDFNQATAGAANISGTRSKQLLAPSSINTRPLSSSSTQHTYAYTPHTYAHNHRQAAEAEHEEHLAFKLSEHCPIVNLPRPKLCKEEQHIGRRIAVRIKGAKVLVYIRTHSTSRLPGKRRIYEHDQHQPLVALVGKFHHRQAYSAIEI